MAAGTLGKRIGGVAHSYPTAYEANLSLGPYFRLDKPVNAVGVWVKAGTNGSFQLTGGGQLVARLFRFADKALLASATSPTVVNPGVGGVLEFPLPSPVTLEAGVDYALQVRTTSGSSYIGYQSVSTAQHVDTEDGIGYTYLGQVHQSTRGSDAAWNTVLPAGSTNANEPANGLVVAELVANAARRGRGVTVIGGRPRARGIGA